MNNENRINQHWDETYNVIEDFQEISKTETIELDLIDASIIGVVDNGFILTADISIIKRYEDFLGIIPQPDETIEFRRQRILNRLRTKPPFTQRYLQQQMDKLVGSGVSVVNVDVENFLLIVTLDIEDAPLFREVIHTINTMKPANIEYQQKVGIMEKLGLKENISTRTMNWNYILDSWTLGDSPFMELGAEVVIK